LRKKKEGDEVDDENVRVNVVEMASGKVISGEDAPLENQLQTWLEMHPGWQVAPREDEEDDSDLSEVDDEDRAGLANDKLCNFNLSIIMTITKQLFLQQTKLISLSSTSTTQTKCPTTIKSWKSSRKLKLRTTSTKLVLRKKLTTG